ncbi:MAG TPA: protein kinase, partial [Acidobacteriota bacterium]|nr:protein kinase [Acidobacteriota bacterium]
MLEEGAELGPYRITGTIGAGGMGEVYRARDTRLGREVAVKVIRSNLMGEPDRLKRFEQEARAASMLNHPNILTIYDIGTHDGSPYIVSELLEGENLRSKLLKGPLSPPRAIEYSLQIASGLSAAHEKGIVHRDLKPENLFLTNDGRVKLLDFGLAKLLRESSDSAHSEVPTVSHQLTATGVVIGTAAYMSPEQVRGQPVDHRSDIFSFGAILWEMLSGSPPFWRGSSVETMSAILKEELPDLAGSGRALPAGLQRIVGHCLEKDPAQRFQCMRDLAFDLETQLSETRSVTRATVTQSTGNRIWQGALVLCVAALLALAYWIGYKAAPAEPSGRIAASFPTFRRLTFQRGVIRSARFAPDGQTVVYGAAWQGKPLEIFATIPQRPESRALNLSPADVLSISSSGLMALCLGRHEFVGNESIGKLAQAPFSGGGPRELLDRVSYADWAPDGQQLAVVHLVGSEYQLEFPIGNVLYETGGWISDIRMSPRGDLIAFVDHPLRGDDRGALSVVNMKKEKKTLSRTWASAQGVAWLPGGSEIALTASDAYANALYYYTLSGRERLACRVAGRLRLQDIAPDGTVLLARDDMRNNLRVLAPGDASEKELSWQDGSVLADLSDDGRTIVFFESWEAAGEKYGVYIRSTDGSPAVRLADGIAGGMSPDGSRVLSISLTSPSELAVSPVGAGQTRTLPRGRIAVYEHAIWFPDGQRILIAGREEGKRARLFTQDLAGGLPEPITPEGVTLGFGHQISPDSGLIAATGPDEIPLLYPVAGGSPRTLPQATAGEFPIGWSKESNSVYLSHSEGSSVSLYRIDILTGRKEHLRDLTPSDTTGLLGLGHAILTPDAKYYGYGYVLRVSDLYLMA